MYTSLLRFLILCALCSIHLFLAYCRFAFTVYWDSAYSLKSLLWTCFHAGSLFRRAEMYQEYMKQLPIPTQRSSIIPFTSWVGLGNSIKQLYEQPLHYLTNIHLKQWDQLRFGTEDEHKPLDSIVHPCKAEATIWLIEEVHRLTSCHHHLAKLWLSDPMHYVFIDSITLNSPKSPDSTKSSSPVKSWTTSRRVTCRFSFAWVLSVRCSLISSM